MEREDAFVLVIVAVGILFMLGSFVTAKLLMWQ
jgi:hypothetical protein